MSVLGLLPGPTLSFLILAISFLVNTAATFLWTMILEAAVHLWPVVPKAPQRMPSTAKSKSASSMTMIGFFPPNSKPIFFNPAFC